jgi:UDP-N-acetylmuramoyl-tripeptide--D-alanyl-D-alanine ligase
MPNYSIDTRTLKPGDIFIPVKGPFHDGHDFIEEAKRRGAAQILDVNLGEFATQHRRKFPQIPVIGVTGSSGKTTVKDLLGAVLSQKYKNIVATFENQNNEVGVPLTVLKINAETDLAIVEMAMRARGEIEFVSNVALPTHCLITNIGSAHIERLGTRENIAHAKAEIFQPGSQVFLHDTDDFFALLKSLAIEKACAVHVCHSNSRLDDNQVLVTAVAKSLGLSDDQIAAGFAQAQTSSHRMKWLRAFNGAVVIDDTYNANPDSMAYLIDVLKTKTFKRRVLVLGDMLELGDAAADYHANLPSHEIDLVFTLGALMKNLNHGKQVFHFERLEDLLEALKQKIDSSDTIGIKGSRGMKMERVVEALCSD